MNDERIIRKVTGNDKQLKINIPSEFGFTSNDYIELVKIDANSFKVVKIDLVQKDGTKEIKDENCKLNN